MRELIDRGYIYIAQAPLYKVTRGKSEQYLKNEHALEDYLIDTGLEDAVFRPYSGDERAGADLQGDGRGGARDPQHARRPAQPLQSPGGRAGGDRRRAHADDLRRRRRRRWRPRNTSRAGSMR